MPWSLTKILTVLCRKMAWHGCAVFVLAIGVTAVALPIAAGPACTVALGNNSPTTASANPTESYSAQDFPSSQFWTGVGGQDRYSKTAAETANSVSQLIHRSDPQVSSYDDKELIQKAFRIARYWRNTFAMKSDPVVVREEPDIFYTPLDERYQEYSDLFLQAHADQMKNVQRGQRYRTYYVLPNGVRIESTQFEKRSAKGNDPAYVDVFHPTGPSAMKIYEESQNLLVQMLQLKDKNSQDQALQLFAESMYAYYVAAPMSRGSAAIGKVVFAGVYLAYFGHVMKTLPDGIDLEAIIRSDETKKAEFIQLVLSWLK